MMSLGPWFGGGGPECWYGSDLWDWDPLGLDFWTRSSDRRGGDRGDEVSVNPSTNVDWHETDNTYIFRADLPGVMKEDLKVRVEDGNIHEISGERVKEEEEDTDKWHRVERGRGSFVRRFGLPEDANQDGDQMHAQSGC